MPMVGTREYLPEHRHESRELCEFNSRVAGLCSKLNRTGSCIVQLSQIKKLPHAFQYFTIPVRSKSGLSSVK